ncbi:MAG: hypothetical protein JO185_02695 [Acidobacteriaceae bacterium]|nr:hypothetical protein [Acidobacteriaceae bacterium]
MAGFSRRGLFGITAAVFFTAIASLVAGKADDENKNGFLNGRIVAAGIPGVSAISQVGTFLPGGPIHDNPVFAAYTQPGRVLDPARILVGSTSNFGETLANSGQLPGSFLSIDPRHTELLIIPPLFAAGERQQALALGGRVQMFSAQNPTFLNLIHNSLAAAAGSTGVSNPLGPSINNAFGTEMSLRPLMHGKCWQNIAE